MDEIPTEYREEFRDIAPRGCTTAYDLLIRGATDGRRDWCILARYCGIANASLRDDAYDMMLVAATKSGCRELCELARSWGAKDWTGMLYMAARYGRRDLCELAREWADIAGAPIEMADIRELMFVATDSGRRAICELAREWSHNNIDIINEMAKTAAECGYVSLCKLAREWAGDAELNIALMLRVAARGGHCSVCKLLHSWGADHIDARNMLLEAASMGHADVCKLARSWYHASIDAQDLRAMLYLAAYRGAREVCKLARTWSIKCDTPFTAADYTIMANAAFRFGRCMYLSCAPSFGYEIGVVLLRSEHFSLYRLALKWIRESA